MRGVILQTFSALSSEVYKPPAKVFALWLKAKKKGLRLIYLSL